MLLEIIGYIGAFLLTIAAIPQLIKTYMTKSVDGLSFWMLFMWSVGCFSMFIYVTFTTFQLPLVVNYLFNSAVSIGIFVLYLKYRK